MTLSADLAVLSSIYRVFRKGWQEDRSRAGPPCRDPARPPELERQRSAELQHATVQHAIGHAPRGARAAEGVVARCDAVAIGRVVDVDVRFEARPAHQ